MARREIEEPWASAMIKAGVTDPRNPNRPSWSEMSRRTGKSVTTLAEMAAGGRETSHEIVETVAQTLNISPVTVSRWAKQVRTEPRPYMPPRDAGLMSNRERSLVDELIKVLVTNKREGNDGGESPLVGDASTTVDDLDPPKQRVTRGRARGRQDTK